MRSWGLDVSTDPRKTVAVALDWAGGDVKVGEIRPKQGVAEILTLLREQDYAVLAADVPFGWPTEFASLVAAHQEGHLAAWQHLPGQNQARTWRTTQAAHRVTDIALHRHEQIKRMPLSASFDRLGATAAMWALIEADMSSEVMIDRSGTYEASTGPMIIETYPAAQLAAWGRPGRTKPDWSELQSLLPGLEVDPDDEVILLKSDDARDALICAVSARARALGRTLEPDQDEVGAARREGWIHVTLDDYATLARIQLGAVDRASDEPQNIEPMAKMTPRNVM